MSLGAFLIRALRGLILLEALMSKLVFPHSTVTLRVTNSWDSPEWLSWSVYQMTTAVEGRRPKFTHSWVDLSRGMTRAPQMGAWGALGEVAHELFGPWEMTTPPPPVSR